MALPEDEQKIIALESMLETERSQFTSKLNDLFPMIKDIDKLAEAQVLMLSYRHMMVDSLIKYKAAMHKKKSSDINYRKLRYEFYKTSYNVKLDYREINDFINSDMSLRNRQLDMLETQIEYYSKCIDSLDRLGWSIKNRITIAELNNRLT